MPTSRRRAHGRPDTNVPQAAPATGPARPAPARPGPGAAAVEPIDDETPPVTPLQREPEVLEVFARFSTASAALAFAEQAAGGMPLDNTPCARGLSGQDWWVGARLILDRAREMAGLCAGRLYVSTESGLVRDRGWGDGPGSGPLLSRSELAMTPLLELVRIAGLHPTPARPLREAVLLLPGCLVTGLLRRALDLSLGATYQQVRLDPLFDRGRSSQFSYAVRLRSERQASLPHSLLAALHDDPFALVCRSVDKALLIQDQTASPLSDRALASLVTAAGDESWVMASPPHSSARLAWLDEPTDAISLVQTGLAHALTDLDGTQPWAESDDAAQHPQPAALTLVRSADWGVPVDAVLLDDVELDCLESLLAGEPLADSAFLVRGRDRHLLSAPGGLLTELPVGEALTCVGPGSLYLPIGYRIDPPLPPTARGVLFPTDPSTAKVVLPQSVLLYDLDSRRPVWRLWAGPIPHVDRQLPRSVLADLDQVEQEVGQHPAAPSQRHWPLRWPTRSILPAAPSSSWQEEAYRAEREGDYGAAAQLYARHNDPLRAARLYERLAQESS